MVGGERISDLGFRISGRRRPAAASFRFCLRLSHDRALVVQEELGIRNWGLGQVAAFGRIFYFAFGSHSGGVYFSSSVRVVPSPASRELPGDEFTF